MTGIDQRVALRLLCATGVLSMLWVMAGVSPAILQHQRIQNLVHEASISPLLRDATVAETHDWLQQQFQQYEVLDLEAKDIVAVRGRGSKRVLNYRYEVKRPLIHNINYVLNFSGES